MMTMLQELLENTELQNLPEEVQHKLERTFSDQQSLINNLESRNVQLHADLVDTQKQLKEKEAILELNHSQSSVFEFWEKLVEDEEVLQSQNNWLINNELRSKIMELLELEREKGNEILELKENLAYKEDKVMRLEEQVNTLRSVNENLQKQAEELLKELKKAISLEEQSRFSKDTLQKPVKELDSKPKQNENRIHEKEVEAKILQEHLHSELPECQESLQFRDGIEEQMGMELPEKEESITLLVCEEKTLEPFEATNGRVTDTNQGQRSAAVDEQKEEMEVYKSLQEPMDFSIDKDDKQREDLEEKKETQDSAPVNMEILIPQNSPNSAEDGLVISPDPVPGDSNINPVVVSESTMTPCTSAEFMSEASASVSPSIPCKRFSGKRVTFKFEGQMEPYEGPARLSATKRKQKKSTDPDTPSKYGFRMNRRKRMRVRHHHGAKRSLLSIRHEGSGETVGQCILVSAVQSSDDPQTSQSALVESDKRGKDEESEDDEEVSDDENDNDDTDILDESDDTDEENGKGSGAFTFKGGDAASAENANYDSGKEDKMSRGNELQGSGDGAHTGTGAGEPTSTQEEHTCLQGLFCCLPPFHICHAPLQEYDTPAELPAGARFAISREESLPTRSGNQAAEDMSNGEANSGRAAFAGGGSRSYFDKRSPFPLQSPQGMRYIFPSFETFQASSNYFDTPEEDIYGDEDQAVPQSTLLVLPIYMDQLPDTLNSPQVAVIPISKLSPTESSSQANYYSRGQFPSQGLGTVDRLVSVTHKEGLNDKGNLTPSLQDKTASVVLRPEFDFFHRMLKFTCQELVADTQHISASEIPLEEADNEVLISSDSESNSSSLNISSLYSDSSADDGPCHFLDLDSQHEEEVPWFLMDPFSTSEDSNGSEGVPYDQDGR